MKEEMFMEVLNPGGDTEIIYRMPAKRLSDLKGKTMAVIDNQKDGGREFLNIIKTFLEKDFPGIKFVDLSKRYGESFRMKNFLDQIRGVDAVLYALGD
jgi:hypothetical protein